MTILLDHIALQLKQLRTEKGWSLDQTAKQTGISKAMLGQIERGESNPTVQTLWKIAMGFHTSLSHFLPIEQKEQHVLQHQDEALSVKILQAYNPDLAYEVLLISLKANTTHHSCAHDTGVMEDILPLSHTVKLGLENEIMTAKMGEVLRFSADQNHAYINENNHEIQFYNIVHYPK
ncbi:helix-turn-helix domain-containing protein [Acinetobacter gerneri]|uniref:helix-turn-helix domain-containing protein n=1 Tax=Acinetobacter gerneri TaxID=202952 RepID=UPI0028AC73E0|nr:helix-turn-helix domain-containing protein [Acinetobacter gerneri]